MTQLCSQEWMHQTSTITTTTTTIQTTAMHNTTTTTTTTMNKTNKPKQTKTKCIQITSCKQSRKKLIKDNNNSEDEDEDENEDNIEDEQLMIARKKLQVLQH
jgi:hypothetical protein